MTTSPALAATGAQEAHYRRLERIYLACPVNEIFRPAIKISRGGAEITIATGKRFHHAANAVHGSVYFKSLDDAAFFAVNSMVEDVLVLTASFTVYFLRPITEGTMRALERVVHEGRLGLCGRIGAVQRRRSRDRPRQRNLCKEQVQTFWFAFLSAVLWRRDG